MDNLLAFGKGNNFMHRVLENIVLVSPLVSKSQNGRGKGKAGRFEVLNLFFHKPAKTRRRESAAYNSICDMIHKHLTESKHF